MNIENQDIETEAKTPDRATFRRMDEGTQEDWDKIGVAYYAHADGLVDRIMDQLRLLDGDYGGFICDRLTHILQTATRAHRDGKPEDYVVCCLVHDIGDIIGPYNHSAIGAAVMAPFTSEANIWMLENHTDFQGYYYFEFLGLDKNKRDAHKDNPHYEHTLEFIEKYDMPAFDPDYPTMALEDFEPMMRRVMARDRVQRGQFTE